MYGVSKMQESSDIVVDVYVLVCLMDSYGLIERHVKGLGLVCFLLFHYMYNDEGFLRI